MTPNPADRFAVILDARKASVRESEAMPTTLVRLLDSRSGLRPVGKDASEWIERIRYEGRGEGVNRRDVSTPLLYAGSRLYRADRRRGHMPIYKQTFTSP